MESFKSVVKSESFEDFEFFDNEGDLDVDLPKAPALEAAAEKLTAGTSTLISALCTIVEEQGMVITIPVHAVAATAVGALTGSLLGGPPGLAMGLLTGAVIAYKTSPRRPKSPKPEQTNASIREIFNKMTLQQKKDLLKQLLSCLKHSNVRSLLLEILKNESIRKMALEILSEFLLRKMGVSLIRPK